MASPLPPHEAAVFKAVSDAMMMERAERVAYIFPVEGGRIIVEAAMLPNPPETSGLKLMPDPPRVDRRRKL